MEVIKIGSKGQIVIPQKIRNELKISEGSVLAVEKVKDIVAIKKINHELVSQFEKSLKDVRFGRIKKVA